MSQRAMLSSEFMIWRSASLSLTAWLGVMFNLFGAVALASPPHEQDTRELLNEALVLHHNTRGDAWIIATDPNERYESLFSSLSLKRFVDTGDLDTLFNAIDEAFEAEIDRKQGMGRSPAPL